MKIQLDIRFTGLLVKPFRTIKYDCNRWNVKAILEHYGCLCADYILGKQFGFYFDRKTKSIVPWHLPLDQDVRIYHDIRMEKSKEKNAEEVLAIARAKLMQKEPMLLYAWTYPLMEAEGGIPAYLFMRSDIQHMTIISGYDASNDCYLLTELKDVYHNSRFLNWYPSKTLIDVISTKQLSYPNTWLEFRISDRAFEIDSAACLRFIKWNCARITTGTIQNDVYCGIRGIQQFASEFMSLRLAESPIRRKTTYRWYMQLLPVLQQRIAYFDFLRIAAHNTGIDFGETLRVLMTIIQLWSMVRKLCYKFGCKGDQRTLEKVRALLNQLSFEEQRLFQL